MAAPDKTLHKVIASKGQIRDAHTGQLYATYDKDGVYFMNKRTKQLAVITIDDLKTLTQII